MIGSQWRIVAVNNTGVALGAADSIVVNGDLTLVNSIGSVSLSAGQQLLTGGQSLTISGVASGAAQNTQPGVSWLVEAQLHAEATISTATPNGTIDFYVQFYDTKLAAYPTALGIWVGSLPFTAVGTVDANFDLAIG